VFDTILDSSRLTSCCCGVARIHISIAFRTHWRTIRPTSCFCGIARIIFCYFILHALGYYQTCDLFCGIARTQIFYCVLHAFGQGQANELLLQDHPNSCFLLCFTHIWKSIRLRSCFCRIAQIYFSIVFYTHQSNIRLANCFCGIVRIQIFYCVLYAFGQYQANELLLQDRPNSCSLLCFTRVGGVSG